MKNTRRTPRAALVLAFALGLGLGAGGVANAATADARRAAVHVSDAWARATPAGARMGAIYMTIESEGGDRLLGAEVPHSVAVHTEIHETVVERSSNDGQPEGRMSMRRVASIELPAGQPVQLKPGGYHVMLIKLAKPLKPGARVPVALTFEKSGRRTVIATVREE